MKRTTRTDRKRSCRSRALYDCGSVTLSISTDDTLSESTELPHGRLVKQAQRAQAQSGAARERASLAPTGARPDMALRPLAKGDEAELWRIHTTPEVTRWWDIPEASFPWDEPESTRMTIVLDGAVVGLIQYFEELEPKYRHAGIDLFLDPALYGRGLGTEAVRRIVRHLIDDRGHHRITIDPATANGAAIRAYEKAGFKPVGVMRQSERDVGGDGWHDSLLMELLAGEV